MSAAPGSREFNAVKKALKERPPLTPMGFVEGLGQCYEVKEYLVTLYTDPDGQVFGECNCLAGTPPIDPETGLPSREAGPCYHLGAVLLFIAEEEKESQDVSTRG